MPKEYFSSTVLEHLMLSEGQSFIAAIRTARSRMLEEDRAKDCSKSAITGLSFLCGGLGIISIGVGAATSGLGVLVLSGAVTLLAKQLDKSSNHASIEGEQILWSTTDIKAWLTQAWQEGYPVGQILTAYNDFCEQVYLSQITQPRLHSRIKTAAGFVRVLNQSPDQFSALPPVVKIGKAKVLPLPLEYEPVDFADGFGQMLEELEEEPVERKKPSPPTQQLNVVAQSPILRDEEGDDIWADETVEGMSRSFGDARAQMERSIAGMEKEEKRREEAAIATRAEFEADPQKLHRGLIDVVAVLACTVIYGCPGSGKGIQVSNAIRELKRLYPGTKIFAIDPKADPQEDGYWEEGFDIVHRKNVMNLTPNEAAQWIYDRVAEFHRLDGPRLLVWDEVMTCVAAFRAASGEKRFEDDGRWRGEYVYRPGAELLKEINYWATAWISSGGSRNIRAWFITQSGNLDDLPFTGGSKTQNRQIVLARATDEQLIQKMRQNGTLGKSKADMALVKAACAKSPVGRAIYLSDLSEWMALAKLENHSGWDRDNQKVCSG